MRPNILVMDDDLTVQDIVTDMLHALGFNPMSAWHGQEAIDLYKTAMDNGTPFDAVILDVQIKEGMGGSRTMQRLRQLDPEVKAIVTSGSHGDPLMLHYEDYGFKAALPKPFSLRDLLFTIESALKPSSVSA